MTRIWQLHPLSSNLYGLVSKAPKQWNGCKVGPPLSFFELFIY